MDFKEFLLALSSDWITLMSGIASVILAIVGTAKKWDKVPPWAFWGTAIACFFLASIRIWTIEHRARLASENHLRELTIPNLAGTISFVSAAPTGNDIDTIVFIAATIKNTGAPSIADALSVKIRLNNGKEIPLVALSRPLKNVELYPDKIPRSSTYALFLKEDFLPLKAISQPIATGGAASGWSWGIAKDVKTTQVLETGTKVILSFTDVTGKNCEISEIMKGGEGTLIDPSLLQKKP